MLTIEAPVRRHSIRRWTSATVLVTSLATVEALRKLSPAFRDVGLAFVPIITYMVAAIVISRGRLGGSAIGRAPVLLGLSFAMAGLASVSAIAYWRGSGPFIAAFHSYVLYVPLLLVFPIGLDGWGARRRLQFLHGVAAACTVITTSVHLSNRTSLAVFQVLEEDAGIHSFNTGLIDLPGGVFATGDRLARFALIGVVAALALWLCDEGTRRFAGLTFVICSVNIYATNRRFAVGVVIVLVAFAVVWHRVSLSKESERRARRRVRRGAPLLVSAIVLGAIGIALSPFFLAGVREVPARVALALKAPSGGLAGLGAGSVSQGPDAIKAAGGEGQIARLSVELGAVGLIVGGALVFVTVRVAIRALTRGSLHADPFIMAAGLYVLALVAWSLKTHVVLGDPYSQSAYALALGACLTRARAE